MPSSLAIDGGTPVRGKLLPYGKQCVDEEDIAAVTEVLRSDWLTTGPKVEEFEKAFAAFVGAAEAVAVSNGTAAVHAALHALHIGPGDEVILPAMTFAATANAIVFCGGKPVFADCDPETLLLDPKSVEAAFTERTKAVITVDYAGQPSDYDALRAVTDRRHVPLVSDACHALGGLDKGRTIGSIADLNTFSFHPVKPMTTGEGGMITTHDHHFAKAMREFRNHCLTSDHRERHNAGTWFYEMSDLGYNYRLTDIQCALGISQLKHIPAWTARRQEIAAEYDSAFSDLPQLTPVAKRSDVSHASHLYVIRLQPKKLRVSRDEVFKALRAENIGVNVHYIPVHLHPYYQEHHGTKPGMCPHAEEAYRHIISLPMFAGMTNLDANDVVEAVRKVLKAYAS